MASSSASAIKSHVVYLYNLNLWAYDAEIPGRTKAQVIKTGTLSKPNKRISLVQDAYRSKSRPTLLPLPEELSVDTVKENAQGALWVGMRPSESYVKNPTTGEVFGNSKLAKPVQKGESIQSLETVSLCSHDPAALRVVCPLGKETNVCYALTHQSETTGLCNGVMVDQDDVFFFAEFRDDTATSYAQRKQSWGKKISERLQRETPKSKVVKSMDRRKFELEEQSQRLAAEIASAGFDYRLTGSVASLEHMKRRLEMMDPDIKTSFLVSNLQLCKLLDDKETPTPEQCTQAFKEIERLWPSVGRLLETPEQLLCVFKCVQAAQVTVKYRHVRMFLVVAVQAINEAGSEECQKIEVTQSIGKKAISQVQLLFGEDTGVASLPGVSNAIVALCDKTADSFEALAEHFDVSLGALKDTQIGGSAVASSVAELWHKYGRAVDTDSAKLYATQLHAFNVQQVGECFEEHLEAIKQRASQYRDLAVRLAERATAEDEDEDGDEEEGEGDGMAIDENEDDQGEE